MNKCECGCGEMVKRRFKWGHHLWKGGRFVSDKFGRIRILVSKDHPRATKRGFVLEHIIIAEKALGKYLPTKAEIHHINGNPGDNRNINIVICEDHAYHFLLHKRERALKACGHANWLKCWICKKWDSPDNLNGNNGTYSTVYHKSCKSKYEYERKEREI